MGIFIPSPGVDRLPLADFFEDSQGTLLSLYNLFSGGALERFSVFVLGIMPYISASIIMQIGQIMFPFIERLKASRSSWNQEDQPIHTIFDDWYCDRSIIQYQYWFEQMTTMSNQLVVLEPGWSFRLMTVITMTAGSCFVMWLGEQITERGIGQGAS